MNSGDGAGPLRRLSQAIWEVLGGRAESAPDGDGGTDEPPSTNGASNGRANGNHEQLRAEALGRLSVGKVMVPRHQIHSVELSASKTDALEVFEQCGHSRLPVYRIDLDHPIGFVHLKDVVFDRRPRRSKARKEHESAGGIANNLRDVLFVPAAMEADKLLSEMQRKHVHLALIIDEFGGVEGLVTIEDLVEQIVGEIQDEHDPAYRQDYWLQEDGSYLCLASTLIDTFEPVCNKPLRIGGIEDDVDTLGGLVFRLAGNVPSNGTTVQHPAGLQFEVTESDSQRIQQLRVRLPAEEKPAVQATA